MKGSDPGRGPSLRQGPVVKGPWPVAGNGAGEGGDPGEVSMDL